MKRKIAQIGPSTLMVSLPIKWVKEHHLKKGDELEVLPSNKKISFHVEQPHQEEKEITINITNFHLHTFKRYLDTLYFSGYTKIKLIYQSLEMYDDKKGIYRPLISLIKLGVARFIGMEIVSQTKNSTEIHCFITCSNNELEKIEKRIYYLWRESTDEFLESLEQHKPFSVKELDERHTNIIRFITYYMRLLDQSNKSHEEKKQLYSLSLVIDMMMDKFRHLGEMIEKYGCTPKVILALKDIFKIVNKQFEALHKGVMPETLIQERYLVVNRIRSENYSLEEYKILSEVLIFLDTLNNFSRAIIIKNLEMPKENTL